MVEGKRIYRSTAQSPRRAHLTVREVLHGMKTGEARFTTGTDIVVLQKGEDGLWRIQRNEWWDDATTALSHL
eukprot:scaffold1248_cov393-Prasinococcus_capsulatus_cf.AAC.7